MRNTLIAGPLLCLPAAALLASAALAWLVIKLRQAVNRRFRHPGMRRTEMGRALAVVPKREGMRDDAPLSSVPAGRLHVVTVEPAAGRPGFTSGVLPGAGRDDPVLGRLDQFHGQVRVELVDTRHVAELGGDEGFVTLQAGGCDPE